MSEPILAIQNVSKRFGALQAVHDLSFEVRAGEIFGFLGPNGAGKTTTLRMIMGITAPDQGVVRAPDLSRIGYLPEERGLFEDTPVLETVAYLGSLRGMRMADARAAAHRLLGRLELGDRVKDRVGALSKGNQQKVQLAGAILHAPALAVLDEPFSGLDPINQELFSRLMRELEDQGTAVLLSAHQLDLVERLADRFLLISRGRAVLSGTLDEIRRAAAGGSDEVVSVHLAPRAGAPLERDTLAREIAAAAGSARMECHDAAGGLRLEILLSRGTDLGPLLARLAERAALLRVETRALPLHEIYLRAVREGGGAVAAEEVASLA